MCVCVGGGGVLCVYVCVYVCGCECEMCTGLDWSKLLYNHPLYHQLIPLSPSIPYLACLQLSPSLLSLLFSLFIILIPFLILSRTLLPNLPPSLFPSIPSLPQIWHGFQALLSVPLLIEAVASQLSTFAFSLLDYSKVSVTTHTTHRHLLYRLFRRIIYFICSSNDFSVDKDHSQFFLLYLSVGIITDNLIYIVSTV